MSANIKVILIVVIGVGACLSSILLSQHFHQKEYNNQALLAQIEQVDVRIEHIQLLSRNFIQNADQTIWGLILFNLESLQSSLAATSVAAERWRSEFEILDQSVKEYYRVLVQLFEPSVRLKSQKLSLQGLGLAFSEDVEEKIIKPYKKEEGLMIYQGKSIDPFKAKAKDAAYDLIAFHLKQQLILAELFLNADLALYKKKKQSLTVALDQQKAQLNYMAVLMSNDPSIQSFLNGMDRQLNSLLENELAIIALFSKLAQLDNRLGVAGEKLLAAGSVLSSKIVSDTARTTRLYRLLNWSLLLVILAGMSVLGALLARNIIQFVENLKKARERIMESEEKLKVTLNSIGDAVISTDGEGKIVRLNNEAERLTGWSRQEAVGLDLGTVFRIINEYSREPVPSPVQKVMTLKKVIGLANSTVLISRDGNEYPISDSAAPIYASDNNIIGVVMVFRDATEKRRAAEALRQSEKKYRDLFNDAPIMDVITRDKNGVPIIAEVNNMFLQTMGAEAEDVIGSPVTDFYTPESRQKHLENDEYRQAMDHAIRAIERQLLSREGAVIDALLYARPEKNLLGKVIGTRELYLNITELKKAEAEARNLENRLQQSVKMEAIGTLAGGIAHDFNNILSAVIGYTELALLHVEKEPQIKNYLSEVYNAGHRAKELVKQILTFARKTDGELKPVQLSKIAKESLRLIRSSIPSTIQIDHRIESDSQTVADPSQIHQIFMNLLTNAAQAMKDGHGVLTVSLTDTWLDEQTAVNPDGITPGDYIKLTVADTGEGIPAQVIGSIFEPYFTTKAPGEGTGMGLAMVHGIVKGYGGAITVASELGRGTTFSVYLPAIRAAEEEQIEEEQVTPTGNERILFVDDELSIARMGAETLDGLGYQTIYRTSSVEALEVFQAHPEDFDLVITDMTMPFMTGEKLAQEILKVKPDIPVILCTGYNKYLSFKQVAKIGIKAVLMKPTDKHAFGTTVRKVLDAAKTAGPS